MLTTRRRSVAAIAIAAAALTTVAACGDSKGASGSSGDPRTAVTQAYHKLLADDTLGITLKLDATAQQLEQGSAGDPSGGISHTEAQAIAGGSITLGLKTSAKSFNDTSATSSGDAFALSVNTSDTRGLIEVRLVDKNLYARADVPQFVRYGALKQSELDQFTGGDLPPSAAFLKDAVAGKWLKLPLQDTLDALGGTGQVPSVSPDQASKVRDALTSVLEKDVTVSAGTSDSALGDGYTLTGNSRTIATDLVQVLKTQFGSIPGADKAFADANPNDVPSKNVTIAAYVKNGKLSGLKLDLTQFMSAADAAKVGSQKMYLEADFDNNADVSAPSGATDVSFGSLLSVFSSLNKSGAA